MSSPSVSFAAPLAGGPSMNVDTC
ncbi:hypothetical protein SPHINGO361_100489 [Sphingomonas sp. EC-HK361]|nr:hypothetical protein SPHINGO361_100489 [Sphingomonas sp. EC-HK361]